jgi:chorismate mutase
VAERKDRGAMAAEPGADRAAGMATTSADARADPSADARADPPADGPAGAAPGDAALSPLRERIDAIDQEIVALLNERARIALEIGRVKQVTGRRSVRDASREEQVIEHVTSVSAGLFPEPELVALYRKLIAATRRVQHAQRRAR